MDYENILSKYLTTNKRIAHSISTAMFMKQYADIAGVDPEIAYVCGILHDVGKELSPEQQIVKSQIMRDRNIFPIDYFDYKVANPNLLHGVAATEILYSDLGIKDTQILIAIAHHTTGGKGLDRLSQYTFMADFIEPLRDFKEAEKIRKQFVKERDFDACLLSTYLCLLQNLIDKKRNICLESVEGYNECIEKTIMNTF